MAVNVIHFQHRGHARWGVVRNRRITPIPGDFATTGRLHPSPTLIARLERLDGADVATKRDVTMLSPVTRNQQFVCQGANYRQHMIESGMDPDVKKFNMIFTKASSCIVAGQLDRRSGRAHVRFLDYEIELGLVLKRDITAPVESPTRTCTSSSPAR